jgi:hypothetical protein
MLKYMKKRFNKRLGLCSLLFVLFFYGSLFSQEEKPLIEVNSAIDTSLITIGDRITYSLTIEHADTLRIAQPGEGVNLGQFEIKDYKIYDPIKKNGRIYKKYEYVISVFDTGKFTIPPFPIAYFPTDSTANYKIIEASAINIYVKSVIQDEKRELRDIKQPLDIPYNYFFLISVIVIGLLLIGVGFLSYKFYKKRKEKGYLFKAPEPLRPAHEIALESLDILLTRKLIEQGKIKEFYSELSEIVRRYMEGRYYVAALEETSAEILTEMREQDITQDLYEKLKELLVLSDLVKFAKYLPTDEENKNAPENTREFINQTKIEFRTEEKGIETEKISTQ